jgi:hypothetical protein
MPNVVLFTVYITILMVTESDAILLLDEFVTIVMNHHQI